MLQAGNDSPSRTIGPTVDVPQTGSSTNGLLALGPAGPQSPHHLYKYIYGTFEAEAIWGSNGNDAIFGLGGSNGIYNDGDYIYGKGGHDLIHGGYGNDYLDGGAQNDILFGHDGNDTLLGDEGDDTLNGGSGEDLLAGGTGNDQLTGGTDADTFYFSVHNGPWGHDVVTDFEDGLDHILITGGKLPFTPDDLTIMDTRNGALILHDEASILVQGVSAQQLTTADFIFL